MSVIKVSTKGNKYSGIESEEQQIINPVEIRFTEPKAIIKKPRKARVSTRALGTNPRAKGTNPRSK
jgi:hypothetical protein